MLNKYIPPRFMQQVDALLSKLRSCEAREKANEKRTEREKENLPPIPPIKGKRGKANHHHHHKKNKTEISFVPPTEEMVNEYLKELNVTTVDGRVFIDWYTEHEWKTAKGLAIKDWKIILRGWIRRTIKDEIQERLTHHSAAHSAAATYDRVQELRAWLHEEYPLPSAEDNATVEAFMAKYAPDRWSDFRTVAAVEEAMRTHTPAMAALPDKVGKNAVMHVLCLLVDSLAESLGTDHRFLTLRQIAKTASALYDSYNGYSMPLMIFACLRIQNGNFSKPTKRFTQRWMMDAMSEFNKWRREYLR